MFNKKYKELRKEFVKYKADSMNKITGLEVAISYLKSALDNNVKDYPCRFCNNSIVNRIYIPDFEYIDYYTCTKKGICEEFVKKE